MTPGPPIHHQHSQETIAVFTHWSTPTLCLPWQGNIHKTSQCRVYSFFCATGRWYQWPLKGISAPEPPSLCDATLGTGHNQVRVIVLGTLSGGGYWVTSPPEINLSFDHFSEPFCISSEWQAGFGDNLLKVFLSPKPLSFHTANGHNQVREVVLNISLTKAHLFDQAFLRSLGNFQKFTYLTRLSYVFDKAFLLWVWGITISSPIWQGFPIYSTRLS